MRARLFGEFTLSERDDLWAKGSEIAKRSVSCPYCGARRASACRSRSSEISRERVHGRRMERAIKLLRPLGFTLEGEREER